MITQFKACVVHTANDVMNDMTVLITIGDHEIIADLQPYESLYRATIYLHYHMYGSQAKKISVYNATPQKAIQACIEIAGNEGNQLPLPIIV